ncbi:hypothetical protein RC74_16025 [Falsihalocynthiibacter arcticus]|uniref:Uncharacterized protein n=1 Tax=Falsihalocynthiibacter arcticus TaxID=1579316 RepID=A0A126V2M6_9RHOB|nr:hypothetical protein RC74_16025 [Falsihalocynthiibacter arcticus]
MNRINELKSYAVFLPRDGAANDPKKIWFPKSSTAEKILPLETRIQGCLATLTLLKSLRMPVSLPWFETLVFIVLILGTRTQL